MRHEQIADTRSYNKVDIAAVWPVGSQVAPLPVPDIEAPAERAAFAPVPAVPDMPVTVGRLIVAAYVGLLSAFAFATIGSAYSVYMISISALFLVAFFAVPRIILGIEPQGAKRPSFDRFMDQGIDTLTGHSSGRDALIQILIVPVFLTFGALSMGIAAAFIF